MPEFFEELLSSTSPPTYKFFNGSSWIEPKSGKYMDIASPVDGSIVGRVPVVSKEEIDEVISKAKKAQETWSEVSLDKRANMMRLAADWIREHAEYLQNILIMEIGKTVDEAKGEIKRTADLIDYYTDEARSLRGEEIDSDAFPGFEKGKIAIVNRVPLGVILAIAPFNYPVNLAASKIAPAILMGNACILKPPSHGSIAGLHLTQAFVKAGIPEGIIASVSGRGGEIGDNLTRHSGIDMIAFTGSTDTGCLLTTKAEMKPLLFECGGNNPVIVLENADMMVTANEIVKGGFSYAGQRCTAIKYVLAFQSIIDKLLPILLKAMEEKVKMGDPRHPDTKLVGPVISEEAAKEIKSRIDAAIASGAKLVLGGGQNGAYVEPTILTGVKPEMEIVKLETFGPVVSFVTIQSMEEAIGIINASTYGLQASIFTSDEGTGIKLAQKINTGSVQINSSPQRGPDHFPFLGVKKSGIGVQGVRYSLEAMSRLKPIVLNKFE